MKKFLALLAGFAVCGIWGPDCLAWGQKGHDVTCAIAQRHLSRKAQKQIAYLLDGKSIVYWSNWMDNASHQKEYAYTKTWHFKNIEEGEAYEDAALCETGDVVTAINAMADALRSGKLNREQAALDLKFLVHLVGDAHCPMHLSHKSDRGGNQVQVQYFRAGKNLHSIWDSGIVESAHNWTFSEWVSEIDRCDAGEIKEIVKGSPDDWAAETYEVAKSIYAETPSGSSLSYDYVSRWAPVVEQQLLKGGLRLASILNSIFK